MNSKLNIPHSTFAFPRYPRYKDSGIEWVGKIPSHWDVKPGRVTLSLNREKNAGNIEETVLSLSYGRLVIKPPEKMTGLVPESLEGYQIINPGDIIIRPTDLQNDCTSLRVGLAKDRGIITPAYLGLKHDDKISSEYLYYLLHSYDLLKVYYGMGTGLRQNLAWDDFKYLPLTFPPKPEQDRIVAFLDQKTAEIDALIAKKQRQIELLDEQKAILINRAITRGLNPNAKLKPSGIKWIGDIPEHWEAIPLRRFIDGIQQGVSPATVEGELTGEEWGVLKSGCCNGGFFREEEHKKLPSRFKFDPSIAVKTEDLLVSRACGSRDLVGSTALVGALTKNLILSDKNFRLLVRSNVDPTFLNYSMNSFHYRRQIEPRISGADGLPNNIPGARLKEIVFPIPPLLEQKSIVQQLDSLVSSFMEASRLAGRQIQSLKTLRSTLIAHAVTGRIKV